MLDPKQVQTGRVMIADIEEALEQAPMSPAAQEKVNRNKIVFAIFKTLKHHAGPGSEPKDSFFVLAYGGIEYCISWPPPAGGDPCKTE